MIGLLFALPTFAQDPLTLNLIATGQENTSVPILQIMTHQSIPKITGQLSCGSKRFSIGPTSGSRGQTIEVKLDVPTGNHQCSGSLTAEFEDSGEGSMPLNFQIQQFQSLNLTVDRSKVDLKNHRLVAGLDRPLAHLQIQVLDVDNNLVGEGQLNVPPSQNLSPQTIEWSQSEPDPAIIRVKAEDIHGFYTQLDLLPWHYNIPHEDVVFESGSAEIRDSETYKLTDVRGEIQKIVDRYSHIATVNLYVAGYTDTVGSAASNASLSLKRAQSIAGWFKSSGFEGNIFYQGFGEQGLAVTTPDNTDEPQNRRAAYIVAAEAPPTSSDIPSSSWKKLP